MRPFRFLGSIGDGLGERVVDARAPAAEARKPDSIGLDVLVRSDHLLEQHAALPVPAAVAAVTEHVRWPRSCSTSTCGTRPCWPRIKN